MQDFVFLTRPSRLLAFFFFLVAISPRVSCIRCLPTPAPASTLSGVFNPLNPLNPLDARYSPRSLADDIWSFIRLAVSVPSQAARNFWLERYVLFSSPSTEYTVLQTTSP